MSSTDWPQAPEPGAEGQVRTAFERDYITVDIASIIPLKALRDGVHQSRKYAQIVSSIRAIGLVEAPVVIPAPGDCRQYYLLDGHLRIEVLKQLSIDASSPPTRRPIPITSASTAFPPSRNIG